MKNIKYIPLLLIILSLFQKLSAQNFADKDYYLIDSLEIDKISPSDRLLIDSCLTLFHKAKHDTDKLNCISNIVEESWDNNVWPKYNMWLYDFTQLKLKAKPSLKVTRKLSIGLASALNNIGYLNSSQGNIHEGLKYYHKSLKIQEKIGDKEGVATSLNNIGAIHNKQGNIPEALKYYHKSLNIYKTLDNKQGLAQTLNNIGHIYEGQDEPDLALEYFHRSLKIYKGLKNERGKATLLNSIGFTYFNKRNLPKALEYYSKALIIRQEIGDTKGIASSLNNIAVAYEHEHKTEKAMEYYSKCLTVYKTTNDKRGLSNILHNIGRMYLNQGNLLKAKEYSTRSIKLANEVGAPSIIKGPAKTLSAIYEKEGNGMAALKMHKLFISMRDSINNEKTQKVTTKLQAKYEYEKEKAINDAEHDKLIALGQKEQEKQKIISFAISIGLILVIVFLVFVFNRLKITNKQKLVIEVQNKEIVDSITYAKRIQEAILPTDQIVKKCLPESFIYYKPKDIIAGDFYWIDQQDDNIFFAAADCTGHGVPGAMISVVCHNAMNSAIKDLNILDPGKILDKTRELVVRQLNKSENPEIDSIGYIRDGMDIALCVLNTKTNQLNYAGAYNPLWILRNGDSEIEEIKANRQSVGKVENPKPFNAHKINLNKGDNIYIFSDGFADQFGGTRGKKFMYKPFKKLLVTMQNETMENQLKNINNHFENWKGNIEQVDDVCVIGVRI